MLQEVQLTDRSLADYAPIIGRAQIRRLREKAEPLRGKKVLHINATSFGGGVAEILHALVPLLRDLGIDARWQVILGNCEFFDVTKGFHNALHGGEFEMDKIKETIFCGLNKACAESLENDYDVVIVHDPQPAAIRHFYPTSNAKWIWRCHVDTTSANKEVWSFLRPYVEEYDAAVFTLPEFVPKDLTIPKVHIVHPAIDPLNLKNTRLPAGQARQIAQSFTLDSKRPVLLQVSRFDMWKDPFGVIDVYRLVKEEFPQLQLALVGSMATDDPEGWEYFCRVVNYAEGDENIHTLVNMGDIEVNALQRAASVIIQKSTREAFGLVVSEALWKRKPVVAGKVGGIPLQIQDAENGFLAETVEDYAAAISLLLKDGDLQKQMGNKAHEWVKQRFLITRLLENDLDIMSE